MNEQILALLLDSGVLMDQPAIQNLDFLRKLIAETQQYPSEDAARLRMIQGTGMGTDSMTTKKGDE